MHNDLDTLKGDILNAVNAADSIAALEEVRVGALGKKGKITALMKGLGGLSHEERKAAGQAFNVVKEEVAQALEHRKDALKKIELEARLRNETLDVTLPVRHRGRGRIHPISQTIDEIITIFADMGFAVAEGPEIEDGFHNFTALNMPPSHPARQMHDTFYLPVHGDGEKDDGERVLRTHTSPVQIRHMENNQPPIRIIAPGRTYRSDYDMTHTPMFHQVEALVIDEDTHMGHLKGCILEFCKAFFEVDELPMRFRPSFFPFTEPSAEIDIGCYREGGELKIGAKDGQAAGWLEIGGSGMVHPRVLRHGGIDPEKYQGFAFGMGIERMAMLKYGIPDLRTFFDSDTRWLDHYGFDPFNIPSRSLAEKK